MIIVPKKCIQKNAPTRVFGPKVRRLRPKMGVYEERSGNDRTGALEQNGPFSSSIILLCISVTCISLML